MHLKGEDNMYKSEEQFIQDAIDIFVELGVCKYLKDMETYHGRANIDGKRFSIKNINNSGNNTGNMNVSVLSGLYTAKKDIAEEFAQERAKYKSATTEVHKIVGINENDLIFNLDFDKKNLSERDLTRLSKAFRILSNFSVTSLLPINFKYKEIFFDAIFPVLNDEENIINMSDESRVFLKIKERLQQVRQQNKNDSEKLSELTISDKELEKLVSDYISAKNTRNLLRIVPFEVLNQGVEGGNLFFEDKLYAINRKYIAALISHSHIVGFEYLVDSATLRKKIHICQLIDIKQIMTEKDFGEYYQELIGLEQAATQKFADALPAKIEKLFEVGSGEELITYASYDQKCKKLFDMSAGIWEGWTVGQHTASVIDFFNTYYSDSLPDNMQAIMKLIFLSHDIGKGIANEKHISQEEANRSNIDTLFDYINVGKDIREIVKFVIGRGQKFTTEILIKESDEEKDSKIARGVLTEKDRYNREKQLIKRFNEECFSLLSKIFGTPPKKEEVDALRNMCIILQFCDSGSYTYYGKVKEKSVFVSGGNERFTKSFELTDKDTPILKKSEKLGLVLSSNKQLSASKILEDDIGPLIVM